MGGDDPDDVFLVDLIACYFCEALPRLSRILGAVSAFQHGQSTYQHPGSTDREPPQPIEVVMKEQAHALKGSAANIRLWKLAKVSEPKGSTADGGREAGREGGTILLLWMDKIASQLLP